MTPKAALAAEALSSLAAAVSAVAVFAAAVAVVAAVTVFAVVAVVAAAAPVGSAAAAAVASAVVGAAAPDGAAAPVGAVAVAAQGQVLVPEVELPGRDPLPVPPAGSLDRGVVSVAQGGAPEKDGSLDKDRVFVPQAGAFEEGLASVPQIEVLQVHYHGTLSATHRPGQDDTCYKNSGHNADHNGGRANRGIFA